MLDLHHCSILHVIAAWHFYLIIRLVFSSFLVLSRTPWSCFLTRQLKCVKRRKCYVPRLKSFWTETKFFIYSLIGIRVELYLISVILSHRMCRLDCVFILTSRCTVAACDVITTLLGNFQDKCVTAMHCSIISHWYIDIHVASMTNAWLYDKFNAS